MTSSPPDPPRSAPLPLKGRIYAIRVIFTAMALAMLVVNDLVCHASPLRHGGLLVVGALYPHLAHLLFGRFDPRRRHGHWAFVLDGLFIGGIIGALDYALTPSATLLAINLFNWTVIGGARLIALGMVATILAAALTALPGNGEAAACAPPDWLASLILVAYLAIVGQVIRYLLETLRYQQLAQQQASDAAVADRLRAERALLAVLPPSLAQPLAEERETKPRHFDEAVVVVLDLPFPAGGRETSSGELGERLSLAQAILARHGFEFVKSLRGLMLACAEASAAGHLFLALDELVQQLASRRKRDEEKTPLLAYAGLGPVTLAFVQAERLNCELLGPTMDEVWSLAARIVPTGTDTLYLTPALAEHLSAKGVSRRLEAGEGESHFRLVLAEGGGPPRAS